MDRNSAIAGNRADTRSFPGGHVRIGNAARPAADAVSTTHTAHTIV